MDRKVSLVLGSGGARGITHIGVIKYLQEQGVVIDEVVGCSIGALIGAAFAEGKVHELGDWMSALTKGVVFRLMDFADPRFGFLKGERVLETLKEIFEDTAIEELGIKYTAVATDLIKEEEVIFREGNVYAAIRASIAIPAVFKGVRYEDSFLVDGGVLNPVPVNHVQNKDNIIVAVNLDGAPRLDEGLLLSKSNAIEVLQTSYFAMRRKLSALSLQLNKPDFVVHVPHNCAGIWDFHRSAELIQLGYELAAESIGDKLKRE